MANTFLTPETAPSAITNEGLFHLENNIILGDKVHREFADEFKKVGQSVTIPKPNQFYVDDGEVVSNVQEVNEEFVELTIQFRHHIAWAYSSRELTMEIDEYHEKYTHPKMIQLANKMDSNIARVAAQNGPNRSGTPGTTPASFGVLGTTAAAMGNGAVPNDGNRVIVFNEDAHWAMAEALGAANGGLNNPEMVNGMVRRGSLGEIANFKIYGDQNIVSHTTGEHSGAPLINGTLANGASSFNFDGMTGTVASALVQGDTFTFDGVYAVNPISKDVQPKLREFVVTADVDTTAGAGTVNFSPALNDGSTLATKAKQNVSALPADDTPVNVRGIAGAIYPQNLAFHRNAIAMATVPLEIPDSVSFGARADWGGYSIRMYKWLDGTNDVEKVRLDVQYGVKVIYPELLWRIDG